MNEDFASNGLILISLLVACLVSLGVCTLIGCTWNWFRGRGFRE